MSAPTVAAPAEIPTGMTPLQRYGNLAAVIVPFLGFIAAIVLLWNSLVGWTDIVLLVVLYVVSILGVTIGFHRLLTHRSFQTSKPMEYVLAILGSLAVEGPVTNWVADHRKHHAHTDQEGDPHSPHVGHDGGLRGLFHAHMGWIITESGGAARTKYAKDLLDDRGMRLIARNFHILAALSIALPFGLGWLLTGELKGALTGALWGGLVRIFLLHHVTWSINSVCHFFGKRRFETEDHSTNVAWLSVLSMGESWHHNHHAFPRSAVHGLRRREIDISAAIITGMEKLGLVWDVVRISPERQRDRLAPAQEL